MVTWKGVLHMGCLLVVSVVLVRVLMSMTILWTQLPRNEDLARQLHTEVAGGRAEQEQKLAASVEHLYDRITGMFRAADGSDDAFERDHSHYLMQTTLDCIERPKPYQISEEAVRDAVQEPPDWTRSGRFSSHRCVGGNCLLRNLCHRSNGQFVYFGAPWKSLRVPLPKLHLQPNGWDGTPMLDVVHVQGPVNSSFSSVSYTGVHVLLDRYNWNVGHTVGDEIVSIWRALDFWDLKESEPQAWHISSGRHGVGDQLYELLTNKTPQAFSKFPDNTCFESVIVGWKQLGFFRNFMNPGRVPVTEHLVRFKRWVWSRVGVEVPKGAKPAIALMRKNLSHAQHPQYIENIDEIAEHMKNQFQMPVTVIDWVGMSPFDQVRVMSKHNIVISLPGSDIMSCVFMAAPSVLIVPFRPHYLKDHLKEIEALHAWENSRELELWYNHMPDVDVYTYNPAYDTKSVKSVKEQMGHDYAQSTGLTLNIDFLSTLVHTALAELDLFT